MSAPKGNVIPCADRLLSLRGGFRLRAPRRQLIGRRSKHPSRKVRLWKTCPVTEPPDGLPTYRVLTGADDDTFCKRVSDALSLGYELHHGPALTFDGTKVIVAQALLWPSRPNIR